MVGVRFPVLTLYLVCVAAGSACGDDAQRAKDSALVQTLLRLPGVNVNARPKLREAVLRHLSTKEGTAEFVDLVERLKVTGMEPQLLQLAIRESAANVGVKAATLLLKDSTAMVREALEGDDEETAVQVATVLGLVGNAASIDLLKPVVLSSDKSRPVRVAAAGALGRSLNGQRFLLKLAREGRLAEDLKFTAANALHASPDPVIRAAAAESLRLPAGADSRPLPPIARLLEMTGDAGRGERLFQEKATCAKCHRVGQIGKEIGPDLSEIGSKLSRTALFTSILDPSAGISHNYETYSAILNDGNLVTGVLINRTDDSITLRTAEAIDKTIATADLDEFAKSPVSLMPADLQRLITIQELVDVVEYLTHLRKK